MAAVDDFIVMSERGVEMEIEASRSVVLLILFPILYLAVAYIPDSHQGDVVGQSSCSLLSLPWLSAVNHVSVITRGLD